MPNLSLYSQAGAVVGNVDLADSVFGIEPNQQVLFDAIIMQRASMRQGTHKTKTRTEVRGGGRKPWRQKGTGRARQGSIRSPQWRGGGVVFGPTPRNYGYKINRKQRRLALRSALSQLVLDNGVYVLDNLSFEAPKTKEAKAVLAGLNVTGKTVVVTNEESVEVSKSFSNIPGVMVLTAKGINVYDLVNADTLIITNDAVKSVEEVLS